MSTYEEVKEIKTLWRGRSPQAVVVSIGIKEITVGWDKLKEEPLKTIHYEPNEDGLMLYVNGKLCASIILVEGSATFHDVEHIQRFRKAIQLFIGSKTLP